MDFPISDLMSENFSTEWIMEHFHPNGVVCVHCGAPWSHGAEFRRTRKSELIVYWCQECKGIYTLYSGTIFAARQLRPSQEVLLMREVLKGGSAMMLARELGMSLTTVTELRFLIQHTAFHNAPPQALADKEVEADEMVHNAGEKKRSPSGWRWSAALSGQQTAWAGTFANDCPPIVGVVGRETGMIRLQVVANTKGKTLCAFVEWFTRPAAIVYTDEYNSYNALKRTRCTVSHGKREWARDDDGWRETHFNTIEGVWTGLRNFLRPFREVSKHLLYGYEALY